MNRLWECKNAVSSVIGTILLVGMTVIMVSIIALSVFAFGAFEPEIAPEAKIVAVEAKGDIGNTALYKNFIVLKHKGGDSLNENYTKIIITGRGYTYTTGSDPELPSAQEIRITYGDLTGENCIATCDTEIVDGTSWDAGETITFYGSDGNDLYLYGWHNNANGRWKLDDGSTVSITIIDTTTDEIIAVSQATVKHP